MGYFIRTAPTSGRFANTLSAILWPAGSVLTATANSQALELGDRGTLRCTLAVTAASGTTPSMTVQMQTSPDGTTWTNLGAAYTAATGVTSQSQIFSAVDRFVRAVATITGTTPSFTFSLSGEAV